MAKAAARRIDVTRLPADVVELIDALGPGEELVITRDGDAVATISSARSAPDQDAAPTMADDGVTVVATAMKLSSSARKALSAELGGSYIVLDMHAAPATADVVLVPPASPQLIGNVRALFPKARVIVTEIEDAELGVNYHGPIRRMLDAGAETYLAATAIPRLAKQLDHAVTRRGQLTGGATPQLEIESSDGASDGDDDGDGVGAVGVVDGELVVVGVGVGAGGATDGREHEALEGGEVVGVGLGAEGGDGGAEVGEFQGEVTGRRGGRGWRRLQRRRRASGA